MGWNQWIAKLRGDEQVSQVASRIAGDCLETLWPRMEGAVADMPLPELRGYVRARSRTSLTKSIAHSEAAKNLSRSRLVSVALDEVARLAVVRALKTPQPASIAVRRAA